MKLLRAMCVLVVLALVLPPCVGVVGALADALRTGGVHLTDLVPRWGLLFASIAWAVGIAVLATMLGWLAAWCVRRHGALLAGVFAAPLLCPSYLAYHSMGLHRAPLTKLGDVIERIAQPEAMGGLGWEALPVLVGRGLAVVGLALWAWPIAMLVLAPAVMRIDGAMLDAARGAGAGRWRVQRMVLGLCGSWHGPIVRSIALVTLVMLGSAVPLHLAQAPSYAIVAWQSIVLTPASMTPWVSSWPLLVMVVGLGAWLALAHSRARQEQLASARTNEQPSQPASWFVARSVRLSWSNVFALTLLGVSLLLPLVSYAISLQRWSSVTNFWRVSREAIVASASVAAVVGGIGALVMVVAWMVAGNSDPAMHRHSDASPSWFERVFGPRRGLIGVPLYRSIAVLLALPALLPGIMTGHAWSLASILAERTLGEPGAWVRDSWLPQILAHVSRFALLAVLLGVWMSASEEPSLRDARLLAGGGPLGRLRGWVRTELRRGWGVVVGVALAMACLSLHEVESSVVLQPAGSSSLAQVLLTQLHFARQEEIAAAAILVLTPAAGIALLAGVLLARRRG
jgi:ABC-type Fe3+ transport system permease subunit